MPTPTIAPGVKLKFFSLIGEAFRTYTYPGFDDITVTGTIAGAVAKDGTHFLLDAGGNAHEIPPSWIHLEWRTVDPIFRWDNTEKGK